MSDHVDVVSALAALQLLSFNDYQGDSLRAVVGDALADPGLSRGAALSSLQLAPGGWAEMLRAMPSERDAFCEELVFDGGSYHDAHAPSRPSEPPA